MDNQQAIVMYTYTNSIRFKVVSLFLQYCAAIAQPEPFQKFKIIYINEIQTE